MELQQVKEIEKKTGRRIYQILGPEYREERIGRFTVQVPVFRIKFRGDQRWSIWSERGGLVR